MIRSFALVALLALTACTDSDLPESVPTDDGTAYNSTTAAGGEVHSDENSR